MHFIQRLGEAARRVRSLFANRERFDLGVEEEMRLHRDFRARELHEDGASPEEAIYAAQRRFGNNLRLREEIHQAWGWTWLDRLLLDLRYGTRRLRQDSGFTAVAVLTLALGIGANTAIYSFMDALLLRSLPVPDPQSLVVLKWHVRTLDDSGPVGGRSVMHSRSGSTYYVANLGLTGGIFPYPVFELFQKGSSSFATLFAYYPARKLNITINGQAEINEGEYVSGDFFRGLAIPAAAGRLISPDDDRPEAPAVVVASLGYSQRRFGSATGAVGQTVLVNSVPVTIVGVAPPEFFGVDPAASPDLYFPLHADVLIDSATPWGAKRTRYLDPNEYWIEMMARLRPGVSMAQAQAELATLFRQWVGGTAHTDLERTNLPALVLQEGAGGLDAWRRRYSEPLYFLLTLVGFILAIACANIANLLLARGTARRREMALRLSIGASRFRLVRQLLTENLLLALLGGMLGVVVAIWSIRLLSRLLANGRPDFTLHPDLNWHVLAVTAALSLITGILFGLAPALQSTRVDIAPALKEIRAGESRSRSRLRLGRVLLISQIGLSLLMLVAAGLFLRTLRNLQSVELGINRENLLLFELNARQAGHRDPEITTFYDALRQQLSAIPGVQTASFSHMALIADGESGTCVAVSGKSIDERTRFLNVGPKFLSTMQVPILLGRENDEHDQARGQGVAVVNEEFARENFGYQNPLGHRVTFGCENLARDLEIIGVTKNAHYGDLKRDVPPVIYVPFNQSPASYDEMTYALRTTGDPLTMVKTVRDIVGKADPRVPVTGIRTQGEAIDQIMGPEAMFAKLCTAFAVLALVIACVGLYGAMSYNVARRTYEIGIRVALGAQRGRVVWMVLREVFLLAALGLAIGLPVALATSKLIQSFLFGMNANDPVALTLAVIILVGAALVAGYGPARRASSIDPMVALRHE